MILTEEHVDPSEGFSEVFWPILGGFFPDPYTSRTILAQILHLHFSNATIMTGSSSPTAAAATALPFVITQMQDGVINDRAALPSESINSRRINRNSRINQ